MFLELSLVIYAACVVHGFCRESWQCHGTSVVSFTHLQCLKICSIMFEEPEAVGSSYGGYSHNLIREIVLGFKIKKTGP